MRYVVQRLLQFVPTLMVVAILVFSMLDLAPGDVVTYILSNMEGGGTTKDAAELRHQYGLDRPFLVRLGDWGSKALRGDLGQSVIFQKPVSDLIADRLPVTLSLTAMALIVAVVGGVLAGVVAALNQGRLADWISMTLGLFVISMPYFWLGLNLIFLFGVKLQWLPVGGYVPLQENPVEFIRHMIMPCVCLGLVHAGMIARMTRTSMLDVIRADYVRTARAKGLRPREVVVRHVLRNALIPLITVIGMSVGSMVGGAIITETVFNIDGLGRLIVESVSRRDLPVVQGGLLVVTGVFLTTTLLVDLCYSRIDPRIRYE